MDLLVPAGVAPGNPKRRGVDLNPHDRSATRRVPGLEAALVDRDRLESSMAGEAVAGVGDVALVAEAVAALADDLLAALREGP